MNIEAHFDLREFPHDVQDILKTRAVEQHRPIGRVIKDYVLESAKLVLDTASQIKTEEKGGEK